MIFSEPTEFSYFLIIIPAISAWYYWNKIPDEKLHKKFKGHRINLYMGLILTVLLIFNFYVISDKELTESLQNLEINIRPDSSKDLLSSIITIKNNGPHMIGWHELSWHFNSFQMGDPFKGKSEPMSMGVKQDEWLISDQPIGPGGDEINYFDFQNSIYGTFGNKKLNITQIDVEINFNFKLKVLPLLACYKTKRYVSRSADGNYEWFESPLNDKKRFNESIGMIIPIRERKN